MSSMFWRVAAVGALAASIPAISYSAPAIGSVSGTITDGQSITITGSSFGTKAQASPLLWDTFEAGTPGSVIQNVPATIGSWNTGAGSENTQYTSGRSYSGAQSSLHAFRRGIYNVSLSKNGSFPRVYLDFWMNVDFDLITRNFKPWRLYGDNDSMQADYVWICNSVGRPSGLGNVLHTGVNETVWGGSPYPDNVWVHYQVILGESAPSVRDGTVIHLIDSKTYGFNSTTVPTRSNSTHWNQIRIGHYWDTDAGDTCPANSGANIYVDNVYIDTTFARVEIGDASTYAASTHREIQIPTLWSDGSVTVNVNRGTFPTGATAYVYLTDSNNVTSAGYPITIGAGSSVPKSPSNVIAE